ncbi:MAG TPA: pilus assembly protein N-terminal domain-containing protein [Bryobacteraceae bacterium]|nr:pilus assembly protein N-terminal domain-containing protein [Bryobacteraceae bacterium]
MIRRVGVVFLVAVFVSGQDNSVSQTAATRELGVTVGKSVLVDSPQIVERISVANGDLAEAIAVTAHEIVINGKAPGETSMIVWQQGGNRLFFDLTVNRNDNRIDGIRHQVAQEMGNQNVTLEMEGDTVFLRGTVPTLSAAQRAVDIASTLGKTVNLLRVDVPPTDAQILIKVKFADVDRSATQQLGLNIFSTGRTVGGVTTGQFTPPLVTPNVSTGAGTNNTTLTLSSALEVFLFRPDLNLGATIAALQSRNLLQILAEPNVLAINGRSASFLAGGEFPFPNLQGGGAGLGAVTIQFREFGVRINFTPTMTPRGTIRLQVAPEVSSLDFANGLQFNGFTIPALSTRRVTTEIELDEGQTFAIGGLLDNRDTETFNKIPGLGDIPFFGKLFRSRQITKNNSELLVMVTPEIVRPIAKGQPLPGLKLPSKFLEPNTSEVPPQTPGMDVTGPVPVPTPAPIPVEELIKSNQASQPAQGQAPLLQFVPMLAPPPAGAQPAPQPAAPPAAQPAPAAPAAPGAPR